MKTALASNQTKGQGKQTCCRQQAIIAAYWATQVRYPDDAAPLLVLRLSELAIAAHRALAMLQQHECSCIDCSRRIPQIGDRNPHHILPAAETS